MRWLSEELSGWPIGSGYYSTNVGIDEAKDMAQAIEEALLADDVIGIATRAFESKWDVMIGNGDVDHLTNDEFIEAAMRAALTAALGIEGGE